MSPPTPSFSRRALVAGLMALALAACQAASPPGPAPHLSPASFADLPGWSADDHAAALAQFKAQCARSLPDDPIHRQLQISAARYQALCASARQVPAGRESARQFFESQFRPYAVNAASGLFTGYFEPELAGALSPSPRFKAPLYRPPPDLPRDQPYATRAEIDAGKLAGRHLEIAWLEDRIAALEIHIQGSGRVRLADGKILRLGFAAHNNRAYTAIGRLLVEQGQLTREQATWPAIKAWLRAHPSQADALIARNERYVFFRALGDGAGPLGALGVALMPERSLAVDREFIPLGMPLWLDTTLADGALYRRLLLAQDSGGAIKGAVRGDIFFGAGSRAENLAGAQRSPGRWFLLLPNPS